MPYYNAVNRGGTRVTRQAKMVWDIGTLGQVYPARTLQWNE